MNERICSGILGVGIIWVILGLFVFFIFGNHLVLLAFMCALVSLPVVAALAIAVILILEAVSPK